MSEADSEPVLHLSQDERYRQAAAAYDAPLQRLARAYEADSDVRRDLLQDIHLALWRSFARFDGRCSVRTWVYRVAHGTAAKHVIRQRRTYATLVSLEDMDAMPANAASERTPDERQALERLSQLIQQLKPLDRQVIVSYLEGLPASSIGEITGLSAANVAMKIHRIKNVLARQFHQDGGVHAG